MERPASLDALRDYFAGRSDDLLHRVLRDGVLVRDADSGRRAEFELNVRTKYLDFLPTLLRYRQLVLRDA